MDDPVLFKAKGGGEVRPSDFVKALQELGKGIKCSCTPGCLVLGS